MAQKLNVRTAFNYAGICSFWVVGGTVIWVAKTWGHASERYSKIIAIYGAIVGGNEIFAREESTTWFRARFSIRAELVRINLVLNFVRIGEI